MRHAESENNRIRCFEGAGDQGGSPLTKKGVNQVRLLASHLSNLYSVDYIYASPTIRTLETAAILKSRLNSPMVTSHELREIDCGDWGDKPVELIKEAYAKEWKIRKERPTEFCFPHGESLHDVKSRITPFMDSLIKATQQQTIVLVSHSAAITIILTYLLRWPLKQAWLDRRSYHANTAFTVLNFEVGTTTILSSEIASTIHLNCRCSDPI